MRGSCNSTSDVSPAHLGYWHGSPTNSSYFFDYDVFHFWDTVQKNMPGSSCSAFVKTLAQISEKKGRVQVSILCIHCTIIMDLINSAAILWIYMFFFCLFFCCFFFDHYIVYFFAGRHNYTFYIFKSLSKMEILPVWALSSIWHEFYELPMLFQCSTCLSQRQKRENILLKKKWMRKFIYPIVYSTNST